jgi:hypothetical protein
MFTLIWTQEADRQYRELKDRAEKACGARSSQEKGKSKSSKAEGLFKQVHKAVKLLRENPRHPGLQTHHYHSLPHPYKKGDKVFEAYAQNDTSRAYRVFWCYGPKEAEITIIAITSHP